jgi:hypothetical protein
MAFVAPLGTNRQPIAAESGRFPDRSLAVAAAMRAATHIVGENV